MPNMIVMFADHAEAQSAMIRALVDRLIAMEAPVHSAVLPLTTFGCRKVLSAARFWSKG